MDYNIVEGIKGKMDFLVTENDTAAKYASGNINVYATPAMIGLMENTAKTSVDEKLPNGFSTVGIEVNIKHLKATPVGMMVTCESELTKVEGKKLLFTVNAWDEKGKIGEGTHTRYIINIDEFMNRL